MRRVGILGGMGPEATILIMQRVLARITAHDDADHLPLIVDQNPQVPSRIRHLIEGTGENPAPTLADMARRLVAGGAEALAMPCNTAHHYAPAIRSAVSVPFLDMVDASAAHAAALAGKGSTVGVLASPAVRKVGVFDAAFERYGLRLAYPEDEAALLAAIRQIKATGPSPEARESLCKASLELHGKGALVQMIACTEFSLVPDIGPDTGAHSVHLFDTLDCLVDRILSFALARQGIEATNAEGASA